ncbi:MULTISPECIES: hypothetical protein [Pectobacterium]|uniref:hypothetical protein n=1 Tax=Pectobacterium TaxID=122277 RepID=UPI0015DDCF12|nr:hypothetical protein [Pectobacterium odoriferum]MBA0186461.1 hypothetical protein [Pectobacterium odoriferum]MCA6962485.1 hypothetical protein [Pectobacterium odoriferum]MCH5010581.1 hypothetical protein [Pectobacterium odoriferum]
MKNKYLALTLLICLPVIASEPSLIVCKPQNSSNQSATGIWPSPYLSKDKLCFDIRADSGNECVGNGKSTSWFTEAVIVDIDGKPQGRDDTWFRVVRPTITDKKIEYKIEGSRDKKTWGLVSNVSINRLTGQAVDWLIGEHGGVSYQCHLEGRKI